MSLVAKGGGLFMAGAYTHMASSGLCVLRATEESQEEGRSSIAGIDRRPWSNGSRGGDGAGPSIRPKWPLY